MEQRRWLRHQVDAAMFVSHDIELGLRLRYEIVREFAPYVGVVWERKLFRTASYAKDEGEPAGALSLVAGVRFWF